MPRVHLVDATYELFRAWFAVPSSRLPDGTEVGATRGVLGTLIKLVQNEGATHVACATDHVIRSFRNALYDGYKTESGVPAELLSQFPLVEEGIRALGLVVWPMVEFEADDALASGAKRFAPEAEQVLLATPDKDLAQCVRGQHVVMLDRRRNTVLDEDAVRAKYGVLPASIADWLALVGDAADGYPGLAGWGEKSAARVLEVFGSIERIPESSKDWPANLVRGADRLATTLAASKAEALLYKQLALLRTDVPLTETLDDLEYKGTPPEFRAFCAKIGAEGLPERIARWL
ncbi:5'-3' exonuclease H3TH domain-containing protein [Pendulispora albinea]|uniref:Flap endonuclease n=1 Tax=Pendulispora albinea TaxID=2741071 RepID=A0ABZ2LWZ9_9BACT